MIPQMLSLKNVRKSYEARGRTLNVLQGIDLDLASGAAVALMGPSGSGKSTLLNIMGTLEPPSVGTVEINGADPFDLSENERAQFRNRHVGFIFQDHHLLPQCSVIENVVLPTLADAKSDDAGRRAAELLESVGLSDRLDHRPGELSGGERQRVAIARALINSPALVLADEPTGNLDRSTADVVADLLLKLHGDFEGVMIIVTHSIRLAERFDQQYELDAGRLSSAKG